MFPPGYWKTRCESVLFVRKPQREQLIPKDKRSRIHEYISTISMRKYFKRNKYNLRVLPKYKYMHTSDNLVNASRRQIVTMKIATHASVKNDEDQIKSSLGHSIES